MIKYSYIKLTGCLVAAALAPLCTSAQRINTEASVERLKSESLQFSYSDNASGIQLDQMDYYSQVGLGRSHPKRKEICNAASIFPANLLPEM